MVEQNLLEIEGLWQNSRLRFSVKYGCLCLRRVKIASDCPMYGYR